jgi:hypothetical protein
VSKLPSTMGDVDSALLGAMRELREQDPAGFWVLLHLAKLLRARGLANISTNLVDEALPLTYSQGHEDERTGGGD